MTRALLVAAVVLVTAAALLFACRSPDVVPAARATDPACARAASAFPGTLGGRERADIGVVSAARFGDVVVRCGVPPLAPTSDECVGVDDVDWVVHPLSDGTRMTTYGRDPALEVLVPAAAGPAPLLAPGLGAAARALPTNGHRCIG